MAISVRFMRHVLHTAGISNVESIVCGDTEKDGKVNCIQFVPSVGLQCHIVLPFKSQTSFCNIEKQTVPCKSKLKRFDLNGHTIGFCQQTQKLQLHYMICPLYK